MVSGQLHISPALPPGKEPAVPTVQETEWAPQPVWTLWSIEKSVAPAPNRTSAVQLTARRYTELFRLLKNCQYQLRKRKGGSYSRFDCGHVEKIFVPIVN
jgi:hypothetical protein